MKRLLKQEEMITTQQVIYSTINVFNVLTDRKSFFDTPKFFRTAVVCISH